jgi:hypothetical protein
MAHLLVFLLQAFDFLLEGAVFGAFLLPHGDAVPAVDDMPRDEQRQGHGDHGSCRPPQPLRPDESALAERRGVVPGADFCICGVSCGIEPQSLQKIDQLRTNFSAAVRRASISCSSRASVYALHHRFGSGKPVAHPRAVIENQLQPVGPHYARNLAPAQLPGIGLQLLSERGFLLRGQVEVLANGIEGTNLGKKSLAIVHPGWRRAWPPSRP